MAWRISTKFDLQVNLNWGYHTAPITEAKSTSNSPSTASPHPSALYSNINSHHRQTTAATTFKLNNQLQSTRLHPPNWFLTPSSSSSTASSFKVHPQLQHLTCSQHCSPSQQQLAETQQKQMKEANDFANQHAEQLKESQRQLQASQQVVTQLTSAFQALSAQPPPLTASAAPKKKPELPPSDSKNVIIWIRSGAKSCSLFVPWQSDPWGYDVDLMW